MTDHAAQVLDAVEALREPMLAELATIVRIPSVGGTDAENDAQHYMAGRLGESGLEVDHWQLDLADLTTRPDFPGMEVERREAWGVVARLAGSGDGASLMLNGHIDVVPTGDAAALADALQRYVDDRGLREAHGRAGRRRAEKSFSNRVIWSELLSMYRSLLK